jgi:hypothetical protein
MKGKTVSVHDTMVYVYYMEKSGYLHAMVALSPGKGSLVYKKFWA